MHSTIMWDWNGTLLDDVRVNFGIVNTLLERRGARRISFGEYRRLFRMPIRDFYADIGFSFEGETFESVAAEYIALYRDAFPSMRLSAGIPDILSRFRDVGARQYVVSASHQSDLSFQVGSLGIEGYFAKIVGNDDYAVVSKLEKAKELRRGLGADERVLFIGDMQHDFEVAEAIGADCVLYDGGHQRIEASDRYVRIASLGELYRYARTGENQ